MLAGHLLAFSGAFMYEAHMMRARPTTLGVAVALADPLRLAVLHRLSEGPAAVMELVAVTKESQPKVSNHLAVLRRCGLVFAERRQRHAIYRLTGPAVAHLVESLAAVAGPARQGGRPTPELAEARMCYDHLAGKLGVRLLEALLAARVLRAVDDSRGDFGMGSAGARLAARLGIDVEATARFRRRFAHACLDWTEQRYHLGGALGAAFCDCFLKRAWIVRRPQTRAVRLTPEGKRAIRSLLAFR